jgi:hypothetical protein
MTIWDKDEQGDRVIFRGTTTALPKQTIYFQSTSFSMPLLPPLLPQVSLYRQDCPINWRLGKLCFICKFRFTTALIMAISGAVWRSNEDITAPRYSPSVGDCISHEGQARGHCIAVGLQLESK